MIGAALFLITALLAVVLTPIVRAAAVRFGVVDPPGPRKIHRRAMPRLGGVAVVFAAAGGLALIEWGAPYAGWAAVTPGGELAPVLIGAALIFAMGVWDDVWGAPAAAKVAVEVVAALVVIRSGVIIDHATVAGVTYSFGAFAMPVTLIWILTITNAFNLMDGLDGLAAGLAVIAAGTCVAILMARGYRPEALLLVAFCGALAGFLLYNFHPASIFLGDAGSLVIGFVLGATAITGLQKVATVLAMGLPLLIFALPIVDVAASVVRRLGRSSMPRTTDSLRASLARIFQADSEHIHHRLLGIGLSHRAAVLLLYGLALALSTIALLTFQAG